MSRIFVTGSADGLGRLTAETLLADGHEVIVHARNSSRVMPPARVVVGDLADRDAVLRIAGELQATPLDAVIHNAGVMSGPDVMPVNVIAPYLLTALLPAPRLIYLSSGMHAGGHPDPDVRRGSYSDSKLLVTTLAAAVARLRPDVFSNAVDPGWVPTRMGGAGAPDDLTLGHRTQEWLATSDDPEAMTSGGYWHHRKRRPPHRAVHDTAFQDRLLQALAAETGVGLEAS